MFQYALSPEPEHADFDTSVVSVQPYDDYNYQEIYFVAHSFQSMLQNFKLYNPFYKLYLSEMFLKCFVLI